MRAEETMAAGASFAWLTRRPEASRSVARENRTFKRPKLDIAFAAEGAFEGRIKVGLEAERKKCTSCKERQREECRCK